MEKGFVSEINLPDFPVWEKLRSARKLVSFQLEITARCNNNCRHCYINFPADDKKAKGKELSLNEIKGIIDEAVSLGVLWCLITGGEPLLRKDFFDIYLYLKKKGLLVSVFTNAALIKNKHIDFFKKYPPRDIEVTVYGVTKETYEKVARVPGSFDAFMRGLDLLLKNDIKVRFKTMALRSNVQELDRISRFCRERTKDYFRFDPFLHLRFDGNKLKNEDIKSERLSPGDITRIETQDKERFGALKNGCDKLIRDGHNNNGCRHIFSCGAGNGSFIVSYDGFFRLCSSLYHKDCIYDIKKGNIKEAWENFIPKVRDICSDSKNFLENCKICPIINLCMWCPAHSHLETGRLDEPVDYFCEVAHYREKMLLNKT